MKRNLSVFMLILLTIILSISSFACNKTTTLSTTTTAELGYALAGDYEIDITNLGMPLIVFLRIDEDKNFFLSPDLNFDVDKGHGTIGQSGSTYMFIYSDSTSETPKTCTFLFENNNIHFQSSLPYGSSNLHASAVDENNPDITYYLVANVLLYQDYYGDFSGSHTVTAMGSEIEYNYTLSLKSGCNYQFVSDFNVSGDASSYEETGTYSIDGTTLTLTPEGADAIVGTINSDGSIDISIKASSMAERETHNLKVATTSLYKGTYVGYLKIVDGETILHETTLTLVLDQFGNYALSGNDTKTSTFSVSNEFSVEGTSITFYMGGSEYDVVGSIANYVIKASFPVSSDLGTSAEFTLYRDNIQGTFTQTSTVDDVEYHASLTLYNDGTYSVIITQVGGSEILNETGTFKITFFMFVKCTLTSEAQVKTECVVSLLGLNVNFVVNDVTYGFILTK